MKYDILIKNAKTRNRDELVDIAVLDGKITAIEKNITEEASKIINASGNLVTESFVNGHLHLDKVYTLQMAGQEALKEYNGANMGGAMTSIERAADFKAAYDESWIIENVRKACNLAVKYGNTHIRAFADVDSKAKLEGVKALLKAREEYKDKVELQVVAFPQDGVAREPGARELIKEALELGADVVGGIPWIEFTKEDEQDHVDSMCAYAKEYNKPISMLLDDVGDAEERTLEMLCKKSIEIGWQGRVTAQHCRAMELYPENYFRKLVTLLKQAGVGIVSDPQTGPLAARVKDLLEAGVPVALGQDDIQDAYYPFGECNMLQVAFLASHLLRMVTFDDMELLYDMITVNAAKVLGIEGHELKVGGNADLVVLDQKDVYHAIWYHRAPVYVIKNGEEITEK
ncbi:MAG: amidohydrolase family protein [Ruminococcus sp.]|jgi:cytosine deaminase|uniref:Cytosine deaminase n=1 Tax=Schaedlerella arabinosiphila TaxID=2044587 RepID=A0A426DCU5_9FIRM|nr:amidohydrolase family protein [Schaedlerella arabinosiphila]MCI8723711.1 amidohydrolase family protein [Ruminococcus sp.]RRK30551.1 cytosine deaminase [Schaedlerella arabinosiphila]